MGQIPQSPKSNSIGGELQLNLSFRLAVLEEGFYHKLYVRFIRRRFIRTVNAYFL